MSHTVALFNPSTPWGAILDGAAAILLAAVAMAIVHVLRERRRSDKEQPPGRPPAGPKTAQPPAPIVPPANGRTFEFEADVNTGKISYRVHEVQGTQAPAPTE